MAPHQSEREQGKLLLECAQVLGDLSLSLHMITESLGRGARIKIQEGEYWLFDDDGEGRKGGKTLEELIMRIPPTNAWICGMG